MVTMEDVRAAIARYESDCAGCAGDLLVELWTMDYLPDEVQNVINRWMSARLWAIKWGVDEGADEFIEQLKQAAGYED